MQQPQPELADDDSDLAFADPGFAVGRGRRSETRRRRERHGASEVLFFPRPPRPSPSAVEAGAIQVAMAPSEVDRVRASFLRVAARIVQLAAAILYFFFAGLFDPLIVDGWAVLHRRSLDSRARIAHRRAVRLRRILQGLGGTFIKIGQQLAIRADVLPPLYCRELENLLDNAEPIPEAYVRQVLERRGPLGQTFVTPFNFSPLGSASIACVYRAHLKETGEEVAIKVRRPDIVRHFKADLAAFDWVFRTAEFLTFLRPRVSGTFRSELREMLLEELDFRIEIRYQELFRRYYKKRKKLHTTAPRIHFALSGEDVIVSEYVNGLWMKDLIVGVESGSEAYLAALAAVDVDPKKIAKQLIRASHYGFFECPFFHGDPHPGNIAIQPGNRIVLVDFGACGVFAERERLQLALMHYYQAREDVGGMVQCVIGLMEPLPPIDVDALRKALEDAWWKGFYGIKSHHAEWWERTSFRLWSALLSEVREFRIPMPLNVLRMIRATLLYDSVAARIYSKIDVFKEYRKYYQDYAERVKRRIQRSIIHQFFCGIDPANYVRLNRLWDVGNVLLQRTQLLLRQPLPQFAALVDKGFDLFTIGLKWLLLSSAVTMTAVGAGIAIIGRGVLKTAAAVFSSPAEFLQSPAGFLRAHPDFLKVPEDFLRPQAEFLRKLTGRGIQETVVGFKTQAFEVVLVVWLAVMALIAIKYMRQLWFRLCDKDVENPEVRW
jgi:ubiquinone biosynthesis protein